MAPIANPLIQGGGGAAAPATAPPAEAPAYSALTSGTATLSAAAGGGFSHPDNTSTHVAVLVVGALLILVAFRVSGFTDLQWSTRSR